MTFKIAVITPYYKETEEVLRQCHDSVLNQTYECDHFLVADGFPVSYFDKSPRTLHTILPKANGDNGNTPRGIGSVLAQAYGYDAIAYLDADNWYQPDHIEKLVAAHIKSGAAVLSCRRTFHDLEGADLNIREPDEDQRLHVDTSCLLLFRPAFSTLRAWFMPAALGPICDRIFIAKILNDKFKVVSINNRSVAFRTQYKFHYELAGVPVPKGAKSADEFQPGFAYIADPANAKALVAALGFLPIATERPVPAGGNIPPAAQPRPQAG